MTKTFSRLQPHRFPLALLFLLASMLFLGPLLKGEVFVFRDHLDYFQPLRWFTAASLRAGELPLWNPYNASGEPWLANPQTGVFYPPQWLFVFLPFETAYILYLQLHLLLLGWGAYFLFSRTASHGAAMVGAAALMFAGPTLSLLDVSNNLATFAWIPLVVFCARERRPMAGAFALAFAFLAGEPFFAAVAALMFVAVSWRVRDVAIAGLGAFGLSAVQLLPFLELLRGSDRAARLDPRQIFRDSMPLRDWLKVAFQPNVDAGGYDATLGQHFIPIVYVGGLVAALAIAGLLLSYSRRETHAWLALLAFAVVVGAGPSLLAQLPLTLFRYPARLVPLGAMAIVALAAMGWDRMRPERKRWVDLVLILVIVGDLVYRVQPLLVTAPFRAQAVPYAREFGAAGKILRVGEVRPGMRAAWISGYMNLYDKRFDAFTAAPVVDAKYERVHRALLEQPRASRLASIPVRYVLTERTLGAPFVELARRGSVIAYGFPGALPLARFESDRMAVPARFVLGTSRAEVTLETERDGVVVLAQRDAPGWRVSIDGAPPVRTPGDKIFHAVAVSKGRHRIVWTYRPDTLFAGFAMTCITLVSISVFAVVKRRREEKFLFVSHES